ncbi:MAG: peptidylprolyl isomerase [bacterium]
MPVKKGDEVKMHLTGKLKDGRVFATTEGKEPLQFEAGAGQILPGIDEEVVGLEKNEERQITVPPEKGFGKRKEELVVKFDKGMFKGERLEVGQRISVKNRKGRPIPAQVMEIGKDRITLDLNHPFAGKELIFRIKVVNYG